MVYNNKFRYPAEPPTWTFKEVKDRIPARLFERHTFKSIVYAARSLVLSAVFFYLALRIDPLFKNASVRYHLGFATAETLRYSCWLLYWWFQGLAFTGSWVMGHECGHGAFSANKLICDGIGWVLHSLLLTPYFSWCVSHHRHHTNHASMEKDEAYVPKTRTDLGIPADASDSAIKEMLEDTPIYTLFMLVRQQIFAFDAYLFYNVSGQMRYPKWTNHFTPNSVIFSDFHFWRVMASNFGVLAALSLIWYSSMVYGFMNVVKYYGIPWMQVNHWIVMITYLHHTDPILPHFRSGTWNYQRGATATIDRDFLGWQGRFFLYDVAHYHVVHHFFPRMPWYHGEEATKYLREAIGPYYLRTSKPVFQTLWDNYNFCQFVDDEGDVVYYRNKEGKTIHEYDRDAGRVD
ncbi:linoleoyl phosphatidylcholine delta-12 acetylenase [Lentinus tigrinus ALCF2SS1-7]|uniref:Linoleoyl phosphatidylcholine delta-12 acetylenase n=1 Tax=Lentinus tigrinus ALCF2SS1-6 TaxID=1328759 RepID=A0A5C2RRB2_9APHY|nr:linoleoyl phosphatidylcholine delta-12 acetylenase [Lentinus tigrinus ALCF2SS1-6]RPD73209.1 linoleoyl phosphatidylcholine delta-12 acetylenase [Lentinus tigrinus ALCF2SS1-7]